MNKKVLLFMISTTLLLTACGGSVTPSSSEVPSSSGTPSSSESIISSYIPSSSTEVSSIYSSTSESSIIISSSSEEKNIIEELNKLLAEEYSHIKVNISTTKGDLSLQTIYVINKEVDGYHISYDKEKYNTIDIMSGSFPSEMKSHEIGSYVTKDNEYSLAKFTLQESMIKNCELTEDTFVATINNGKEYLGADYNCKNLIVNITFADNSIELDITYSLDDDTLCAIDIEAIR